MKISTLNISARCKRILRKNPACRKAMAWALKHPKTVVTFMMTIMTLFVTFAISSSIYNTINYKPTSYDNFTLDSITFIPQMPSQYSFEEIERLKKAQAELLQMSQDTSNIDTVRLKELLDIVYDIH